MKILLAIALAVLALGAATPESNPNLIENGTLEKSAGRLPTGFESTGSVDYGPLADPRRDMASRGFLLQSTGPAGEIATTVKHLDYNAGRWFRFTFRGLPQSNFAVTNDDLSIKVAFFGDNGRVSYDAKATKIYDQIETTRRDLAANGRRRQNGAESWHTYQLDFMLPFPQVDQLRLSVGFGHGAATAKNNAAFLIDDLSLIRIPEPAGTPSATTRPLAIVPEGKLLPLGGRWFYAAKSNETAAPRHFDTSNVDRLLYHDDVYSAPFAGNTTAVLRAGNKETDGSVVKEDHTIENVTLDFTDAELALHTHGVPNHPTGRFPEQGFGNPNAIQDRPATYYIPLAPKENPKHFTTDTINSNGALHMGPIGIAVNGVVFFNPFDMGNTDATDMMDRCCGHPNQMNLYHYHKYPICINSPWSDAGESHSPLLGFAFDGYPLYGPYEDKDLMAKDAKGDRALNPFNMHYDEQRGWHYHVTPGQFPYLIGGFWGVEDPKDSRRGPPGGMRGGQGPGGGNRPPPPGGNGGPFGQRPPPPGE